MNIQDRTSVAQLPFAMPSADVFFNAPKKVFAHYFYPFPLSIDNAPTASDYYQKQYLTTTGEGGKHAAAGGYLRARPLGVPVQPAASYEIANRELEVRMAIARGITGFCFDLLSFNEAFIPATQNAGQFQILLAAALNVDPRFAIIPMLDMDSLAGLTQAQAVQLITLCNGFSNCYRLSDGRLLIAAYSAMVQSDSWWTGVIQQCNAANINIAFMPVLQGANTPDAGLQSVSIGWGNWGTVTPASSAALTAAPAHAVSLAYMPPIGSQQYRPQVGIFWEACNSLSFRDSWMQAINTGAEYVQIVTWSDFSESAQVQPSTDATLAGNIGTGFYDLTAYYAAWFATGVQPTVTKDTLYWFHRRQTSSSVVHPNQLNATHIVAAGGGTETNNIECLAFLTAPGDVLINNTPFPVPAGISSSLLPSVPGNPIFTLQRNGSHVFTFTGPVEIYGDAGTPAGITDLTYWSGSGNVQGTTTYT